MAIPEELQIPKLHSRGALNYHCNWRGDLSQLLQLERIPETANTTKKKP